MKKTLLALCTVVALGASAATFEKGTAYTYPIGPDFKYFGGDNNLAEMNINWPDAMMDEGCSFWDEEEGGAYGTMAIWFNNAAAQPTTWEAAAEICPVVADPWNEGDYALKMHAPAWWGFGNFNCALPKTEELCRVRVIYRVDVEGYESYSKDNGILVRITDAALAGPAEGVPGPNSEELLPAFWENTGYRVIDYYTSQLSGKAYLAITFMPGGFSCGPNRPAFYLEEVSIVPTKLLAGDTHVDGDKEVNVVAERPELVKVEGINASIKEINAAAKEGNVIYDMQGRRVANATKGLYIVNGVKTLVK